MSANADSYTNTVVIENPRLRIPVLKKMLRIVRPQRRDVIRDVTVTTAIRKSREIVVYACEKQGSELSYRDEYFTTCADDLLGQYFEEWVESRSGDGCWVLNQACFHLTRTTIDAGPHSELVALHCEPKSRFMLKKSSSITLRKNGVADGVLKKLEKIQEIEYLDASECEVAIAGCLTAEESRRSIKTIVRECSPKARCEITEQCKRGPHLHIAAAAGDPIKKAHLPLYFGKTCEVVSTVDTLTNVFRETLSVLKSEVLDRYAAV